MAATEAERGADWSAHLGRPMIAVQSLKTMMNTLSALVLSLVCSTFRPFFLYFFFSFSSVRCDKWKSNSSKEADVEGAFPVYVLLTGLFKLNSVDSYSITVVSLEIRDMT